MMPRVTSLRFILVSAIVHGVTAFVAVQAASTRTHTVLNAAKSPESGGNASAAERGESVQSVDLGESNERDESTTTTPDSDSVHSALIPAESAEASTPRAVSTSSVGVDNLKKAARGTAGASAPLGRAGAAASGTARGNGVSPGAGDETRVGAVDNPSAVDVAVMFTRTFPVIASADAAWGDAAFGDHGKAIVTIHIDGEGHVQATNIEGNPTPVFRQAIDKALLGMKGRPLTAKKTTTRLLLQGTLEGDAVHDDWHGRVFALGKTFSGESGSAFFSLAIGRRFDLVVTRR
jgi:hypothetical protein